jgi:predicted nuclease of predicted toxin-antitoxin system
MRLLLDQGLPRTAASLLRQSGIDTLHVGEIAYATAEDEAILQLGRDEGRVIVTLDADFHALLARSNAGLPSVIRIRIEGLHADALVRLLQDVLTRCEEDLERGAVVTVQPAAIRIRRLPLRSRLPSAV